MKIKEYFKKLYANKNLFISVCVILLTISVIGVSYSAFFNVQSNTVNQTATTGTLTVSFTDPENITGVNGELLPLPDKEALNESPARIIHIQNESKNLSSEYTLTIGYDMDKFGSTTGELTPLEYIRFAVYEISGDTKNLIVGPINITDLPIYKLDTEDYRNNRYTVLVGSVGAAVSEGESTNNIKDYQIKIWLSDQATSVASDTYFYVNSEIVATVEGAKDNYNLTGRLLNEAGSPINGATIDIQNASKKVTTDASGNFTISNLPEGTYNMDIKVGDEIYNGNIKVAEGTDFTVSSFTSASASDGSSIFEYAYTNGTTISKVMAKNSLTGLAKDILLEPKSYNLYPTYAITSNKADINNLTFKLIGDVFSIESK